MFALAKELCVPVRERVKETDVYSFAEYVT